MAAARGVRRGFCSSYAPRLEPARALRPFAAHFAGCASEEMGGGVACLCRGGGSVRVVLARRACFLRREGADRAPRIPLSPLRLSLFIADMAPYYEIVCKRLGWNVDASLLEKMR